MKHKKTKALEIPLSVKRAVAERDSVDGHPCCIWCGKPAPVSNPLAFSNAHYISRGQGGLGIEENVLTLDWECHLRYDQSGERNGMRNFFKSYLKFMDEVFTAFSMLGFSDISTNTCSRF